MSLFWAPVMLLALTCDLRGYKPAAGVSAALEPDALVVSWRGVGGTPLRLRLGIDDGQPLVRELAAGGRVLGRNLRPEFAVTSGVRRVSEQQLEPLRQLGVKVTPEVMEREKWYAFWDAPLLVPGMDKSHPPRNPGLPRRPEEIRRATATYDTAGCAVKTDGARVEIEFGGLSMGIFSGRMRYTVYGGTNLVRLEAIARTDEPSVAYMYRAGLSGFSTVDLPRVTWRDIANQPQEYRFGGASNRDPVPLKAANRVVLAEGAAGSVAVFPPPHAFFFSREVETNLGYVWYRKDGDRSFSIGVRQAEGEEVEHYRENFALYNAPPGTWQRMAAYVYVSPDPAPATREAVMAFTHGDRFAAVPGYKTMVNHFHISLTDRLRESGSLDTLVQDLPAMKALGINVVALMDFHADKLHAADPGPLRLADQKDYFEAARRHSDEDFLVIPSEEPNAYLGGHYSILTPRPVFWTMVRQPGQPLAEDVEGYGRVYHAGSAADVHQMVEQEDGFIWQAHPRTKGSTGYPDAVRDKDYFKSDRFLGGAFKPGMGLDLSESRLCTYRCFDLLDDMNNWTSGQGRRPKSLLADVDTYQKQPGDDLYPNFPINYVKLERVPRYDADWSPLVKALRDGEYFVTTGEILFRRYAVEGAGSQRRVVADLEWTFPLEFVEVVWGDGQGTGRQVFAATDQPPFGRHRFEIPFDAAGRTWVRFAAWDSAGNGAFVPPVRLEGLSVPSRSAR
ncbi:MAG TPA: hypothetical protein VGL15_09245 [Vicinamibacteria bacterium]|jgi:hypothetical protein